MHRAYHPQSRPQRPKWRRGLLALLPWLAVAYLATGMYSVQTSERAVVRRCGKVLSPPRMPGLHFGFPYGIDRVSKVKVFELKRVGVGIDLAERALGRKAEPRQAECLTGDRNLIMVSAIVQYQITDASAYLFHVAGPRDPSQTEVSGVPKLIADTAASALSAVIASMQVDDVFTVQRIAVQNKVLQATQDWLDCHRAGAQVTSVSLEGVAPPQEVAEAFRDVTAAREDSQRAINEAQGYANRLLPQARGEAQRILLDSEGYAYEVVQKARGDAERFLKVAAQLSGNRQLTMRRLLLETMEEVLPRLKKVIIDGRASSGLDLGLIEEEP